MTTLAEMKSIIIELLGESIATDDDDMIIVPIGSSGASAQLLVDAVAAAQSAITPKVYKAVTAAVSGEAESYVIPSDMIRVEAILDKTTGLFLPSVNLLRESGKMGSQSVSWIAFPDKIITFSTALGTAGATVYLSALWDKTTVDDDALEHPMYADNAVAFYAAAYVLMKMSVKSANTRQFGTKVDSGTPEHLPHLKVAEKFLALFDDAMDRIEPMPRGSR